MCVDQNGFACRFMFAMACQVHITDMARVYILDILPRIVTVVVRLYVDVVDVEQ